MNYRTMFSINAFISILLGLGFLILPGIILDLLGVDTYAGTKLISEFFGIALLVGAAAGLIVPAMGPTSGILHSNWWLAMLIYTSLVRQTHTWCFRIRKN